MKYIIFTFYGYGLPVAYQLQREGAEVVVGLVQDHTEADLVEETPDQKKRRLSKFSGMLDIVPAKYLLKAMAKIPANERDNYWVHFDLNNLNKQADIVRKMGFKIGNFPTKEDLEMEDDREKSKQFVEKYYPEVTVGEHESFPTIDEAIEFLEESEELWALKGSNPDAKTIVPKTKNPDFARALLVDALKKGQKEYENGGLILEKRILDMYEITPQMYMWNGKPVMTNINIELKYSHDGDEGVQVGCGGNLIVQTNLDDRINEISFPKAVLDMYKNDVGLRLLDISLFVKDDMYYFGEFCPNRFGYSSSYSEMAMAGERLQDFFEKIRAGENPLTKTFGVALNMFNEGSEHGTHKDIAEGGIRQQWDKDYEKDMWFFDIKKEEDKFVSVGCWDDLIVFTGFSNDLYKAVDLAYEVSSHFCAEKTSMRTKEDFLTDSYTGSILNRYKECNGKLFTQEEI